MHFFTTRPNSASLMYPVMQYPNMVVASIGSRVRTTAPPTTGAITTVLCVEMVHTIMRTYTIYTIILYTCSAKCLRYKIFEDFQKNIYFTETILHAQT